MLPRPARPQIRTAAAAAGILLVIAGFAVRAQTPPRGGPPPSAAPQARSVGVTPPRLVVMLVIDQFRADYPQMYGQQWTKGLRRLFSTSALFPLAAYPYATTVTCAGHTTIGTGSFPSTHGMPANGWYDRTLKKSVTCTEDPTATGVAFGGGTAIEHHSPHQWLTVSFADELRLQARRRPNIVSISLKPRSAIGMAGHPGEGTAVVWEEDNGTWATSDAYTKTPWPDVDAYVRAHPIASAYGQIWTKAKPEASYSFTDDAEGELQPRVFPHPLTSRTGQPDNGFVTAWERSPWADAYIGDMAIAIAEGRKLGQQPGTDMLAVSFSALDVVGHAYGPRSHEVQDVLVRLDAVIGRLLDTLDRQVGAGNYVVSLAADHGVSPLPEQVAGLGIDAGRIPTSDLSKAVNAALTKALGASTSYVANVAHPSIYLAEGVVDKVRSTPGLAAELTRALTAVNGVARAYWADDVASRSPTDDPFLQALRLSYVPGRSGDLLFVPKPYWMVQGSGTTHGTSYDYDKRVPVLLMGAGIQPGRYLVPASPADIAPTFAYLTGIEMAHTDGRVLTEALARRP